jgi:hypothetical protein
MRQVMIISAVAIMVLSVTGPCGASPRETKGSWITISSRLEPGGRSPTRCGRMAANSSRSSEARSQRSRVSHRA